MAQAPLPKPSKARRALGSSIGKPFDDDDEHGGWWIFAQALVGTILVCAAGCDSGAKSSSVPGAPTQPGRSASAKTVNQNPTAPASVVAPAAAPLNATQPLPALDSRWRPRSYGGVRPIAGAYAKQSYTVRSRGFESVAHYSQLLYAKKPVARRVGRTFVSPDEQFAAFELNGSIGLHSAKSGKAHSVEVEPFYSLKKATWDLGAGVVTFTRYGGGPLTIRLPPKP